MTGYTSRRCSSSPPPHEKRLLDQLEKSFLHALRSGEGEAAPAALLWIEHSLLDQAKKARRPARLMRAGYSNYPAMHQA